MNPYNSVQLVGNELIIVADPSVPRNQVSIKPDRATPTRVWGSINGLLTYSVPIGSVAQVIAYLNPQDKLWSDPALTIPIIRMSEGKPRRPLFRAVPQVQARLRENGTMTPITDPTPITIEKKTGRP